MYSRLLERKNCTCRRCYHRKAHDVFECHDEGRNKQHDIFHFSNIVTSHKLNNSLDDIVTVYEKTQLFNTALGIQRFIKVVTRFDDMKKKDFMPYICSLLERYPQVYIYTVNRTICLLCVDGIFGESECFILTWNGQRWTESRDVNADADFVGRTLLYKRMRNADYNRYAVK